MKYCLAPRSKLMSVSPPPGGSIKPAIALGGAPGEITRKVWPLSTDPNQVLRCVPVPVGPLTKTRPCGSIPISGSPLVWIGSTTADTWRGLRRQARRGYGGRQDDGGCGDQRESRADHPMPPCPQQRAELVTPSVAHKMEASNSDKAAPSVGGSGREPGEFASSPDPGARARAKV